MDDQNGNKVAKVLIVQHETTYSLDAVCYIGDILPQLLLSLGDIDALWACSRKIRSEVGKVAHQLGEILFLRGAELRLQSISKTEAAAPVIGAARVCTVGKDVCAVGEYDAGFVPFVDLATWSIQEGTWARTRTRGERPRFFGGQQSVFLSDSKQLLCFSYADDKQKMDFSTLFTLTLESAQWHRLTIGSSDAKLPTPRIGFAIAHVAHVPNTPLSLAKGCCNNGQFDVAGSSAGHTTTVTHGGTLFMYGGQCGRAYLNQLYILDLQKRKWNLYQNETEDDSEDSNTGTGARSRPTAHASATKGGHGKGSPAKKSLVPCARSGHSLSCIRTHLLLLFGGLSYKKNGVYLKDAWTFDVKRRGWCEHHCAGRAPAQATGHATAVVGSNLVVFGGQNPVSSARSQQLECLAVLDTCRWQWSTLGGAVPNPPTCVLSTLCNAAVQSSGSGSGNGSKAISSASASASAGPAQTCVPEELARRTCAAMCFDQSAGELVIFGGLSKSKTRAHYAQEDYLADLWRLKIVAAGR
jgi:hypothetical protein